MIIEVKFDKSNKLIKFKCDQKVHIGTLVVCNTNKGLEIGEVKKIIEDSNVSNNIFPIIRIATNKDIVDKTNQEEFAKSIKPFVKQLFEKFNLNVKLIDVELLFDGSKMIVYYVSNNRIDFRAFVKELAHKYKKRIEMRQINVRNSGEILSGIATCGRVCCCSNNHINVDVNMKMLKEQNVAISPINLKGLCGKLMCCLAYENDYYIEVNKKLPKLNSNIELKDGTKAKVINVNPLKMQIKINYKKNDEVIIKEINYEEIKSITKKN